MDWLADLGGSVAGTLPLLGAFLDEPFEASPYSPATRLFWNEFYIDIERIAEFKGTFMGRPRQRRPATGSASVLEAHRPGGDPVL